MPLHCRASHMFLLICALSLCLESVRGGTSFLSPAQKPQVSIYLVDVSEFVWSKPIIRTQFSLSRLHKFMLKVLESDISCPILRVEGPHGWAEEMLLIQRSQ